MSVLDRAIVKAFERRRDSQPAATAGDAVACAVVEDVAAVPAVVANPVKIETPRSEAIEPAAVLEDKVATSGAVPSPQPPSAPPRDDQPAHGDAATRTSPLVVERLQSIAAPTQPVALPAPPPLPPAVPPFISYSVSTSIPQIDARVTAPPAPVVIERPVAQEWKWPEICEQLDQFTGDGFRQLAKHLQFAAAQGHKVLAFVSSERFAGRTSVLMTLTRILALEGRAHALLVDADRQHPDLATLTGIGAAPGLCEVLHGQATLQQVIVPRTPGNISSLTLKTAVSDAEWHMLTAPLRTLVQQVRRDYDMVLIDAGVLGPETRLGDCWLRGAADAVITISRQLTDKKAAHEVLDWKQIGIESLGVIETFS